VGLTIISLAQTLDAQRRSAPMDFLQEPGSVIIVHRRPLVKHARHPVQLDTPEPRAHSLVSIPIPSLAQPPHARQRSALLEHPRLLRSVITVQAGLLVKHALHHANRGTPDGRRLTHARRPMRSLAHSPHAQR